MNPSTFIGIFSSIILLAVVMIFASEDPSLFIDLPGLGIVLIGTFAATFISYPLGEVIRIFKLIGTVMRNEKLYIKKDIEELVEMAKLWTESGARKAEARLETVSNPYLRTGVRLIIDRIPEDDIIDLLKWRISRMKARENAEAQLFRVMANYAPAFGMVGTLVGLVNMMFILGDGDMSVIGKHMSVALMTTFYGVLLANLIFKPVAVKLERRTEQRLVVMNMILQGISMMCEKRNPSLIRATMESFMAHHEDEINDTKSRIKG